ncbi:MAG TPA: SDR family NAD(P)-dependent oxidoreductase, partial [Ottowia sp.]|nr:SDR family NAD(P)-dependent oxidoreductase [Ottowia sp.]
MSTSAPTWNERQCLVTGGARGFGLAVTQALLAQGARVTVLGRGAVATDDVSATTRASGEMSTATRSGP